MTHDPTQTTQRAWRAALDTLIASRMSVPFAWGSNDCCLFAADAVAAMTGVDPAATLRGYSTAAEAVRLVAELGGMEEIGRRGGEPIPPLCATAGDVGLVVVGDREMLAVCVGTMWLAPAAAGLAPAPFEAARAAWRVDRA